jgi:hypothetical protein
MQREGLSDVDLVRSSMGARMVVELARRGLARHHRLPRPRRLLQSRAEEQAQTAVERFPDAELHWFPRCGHFPQWDQPQQTVELILRSTA